MMERRNILIGAAFSALAPKAPTTWSSSAVDLSPVIAIPTFAALRAGIQWQGTAVFIEGRDASGDGGAGIFVRALNDPSARDDGVTTLVDVNGATWRRVYQGPIDVRWAGARCTGIADDSAAIARAAGAGPISISKGVIFLGSTITLDVHLEVLPGAQIEIARNVVLTLKGGFTADRTAVFHGDGVVVFDSRATTVGFPEWWGARPDNPDADCQPALAAAIRACRIVSLASADYWMRSTLVVDTPHRTVSGVGPHYTLPGSASRLIIDSASADGVRVGLSQDPGTGPNGFLQNVVLRDFAVARSTAVLPPASGFKGTTGVKLQYCFSCELIGIASNEHSTSFSMTGVVFTKMRDCRAFRSIAGTNEHNDFFVGLFLDELPRIGTAAGDASIYVEGCVFSVGNNPKLSESIGVFAPNGFTDLYILRLETAFLGTALKLGADAKNSMSCQNLHVVDCILDSCGEFGVLLEGAHDERTGSSISLLSNYVAGAEGSKFQAAIAIKALTGGISVTNNQVLGDLTTSGAGLHLERADGVLSQGNMFSNCAFPIVLEDCANCRVSDIVNASRAQGHRDGAISLTATRRSVITCVVRGVAQSFKTGILLRGDTNSFNEIVCSSVDPACLTGGSERKLVSNNSAITLAGDFGGSNLATGVMV